jgi:hypothetical protein
MADRPKMALQNPPEQSTLEQQSPVTLLAETFADSIDLVFFDG